MNKQQEELLTQKIKLEMTKVRNNAIVTGMKSALRIVLDMCNKDETTEDKLENIKWFCEKGLYHEKQ